MKTSNHIENRLKALCDQGVLVPRTEDNKFLKLSYKGAGNPVSCKWNVKIYNTGSLVCTDVKTLQTMVDGKTLEPDSSLKVIQFDDAGTGFPLCGVMVGMSADGKVFTDTVDVSFFQDPLYPKMGYLREYANKGVQLLTKVSASPKTHRIEICSGDVNKKLKNTLRDLGYDVQVVEIKGILQDLLEGYFKEYIKDKTGEDLAYDPKAIPETQLGRYYYKALRWGIAKNHSLLKSGWGAIKRELVFWGEQNR